jgi:hypothetical protein
MTAISPSFGGPAVKPVGAPTPGKPQYGRCARLEIGGPVTADQDLPTAGLLNRLGIGSTGASRDKLVINGETNEVRIKFRIERMPVWQPSVGYIEVYGLNEEDRRFVSYAGKAVPVVLYVGYGNADTLIAAMNAVQINHKHDGADWITKFEGGDGARAFANARVSSSYSSGTPYLKVVQDLGALLGKFGAGSMNTVQSAAAGKTFRNGYAAHGNAAREFKAIMDDMGLECAMCDGEIVVAKRGETTQQLFVITPDSGLVGSPEYASPPHPGKPQFIKARCLMQPTLRPFAKVLLQSEAHRGAFQCRTVVHTGDSYGGDWYTDLELQALKGAT